MVEVIIINDVNINDLILKKKKNIDMPSMFRSTIGQTSPLGARVSREQISLKLVQPFEDCPEQTLFGVFVKKKLT